MKNNKWKVLSLTMAAILVLSACGGNVDTAQTTEAKQETETEQAQTLDETKEQADQQEVDAEAQDESASTDEQVEEGIVIPELDIAASEIPDTPAMEFVSNMKVGWNLGNTLDAYISGSNDPDSLSSETSWGNPKATKEMMDALKAAGFETVRIPVTWHNHIEKAADGSVQVSEVWLDRVQEVVDYAIDAGLYVIINIHHDTDEVEGYYPDSAHYEQSSLFVRGVWYSVAERFKEYDEHLIFESLNEPRLVGTNYEWNFQENVEQCQDSADCINRLNQAFVEIVRKSGGNNAERYLMVPGYSASLAGVASDLFVLPTDTATDKLIVSNHAYTPYNFALQPMKDNGSTDKFNIVGGSGRSEVDSLMAKLYAKFVSQGIPVVMGEYGAINKNDNLQERVNFHAYYIAAAKAKGIVCVVWDNGAFTGDGEQLGLLKRQSSTWAYPEIMEAIMKYS